MKWSCIIVKMFNGDEKKIMLYVFSVKDLVLLNIKYIERFGL